MMRILREDKIVCAKGANTRRRRWWNARCSALIGVLAACELRTRTQVCRTAAECTLWHPEY